MSHQLNESKQGLGKKKCELDRPHKNNDRDDVDDDGDDDENFIITKKNVEKTFVKVAAS